ncbi:spore maturation protein [Bacillus sp. 1P06AnD]|uniref:spore maturation protein n=1 Tax=Bacillus sp. 1P06AnD TaxID=3132208 RepID=UPI0039A11BDF
MDSLMLLSTFILPLLIGGILLYGTYKKVPTYESFVEGGKEGITISFSIIPYLVGMLAAISVFRASGAMDALVGLFKPLFSIIGIPSEIVPLALIRPISGNAALGLTSDLMAAFGPDSLIGRLASTIQGSTDTTFYVLTVYFGAVGIRKMGDAVKVGLLADLVGLIAAITAVIFIFGY